jgi:hypothetical protein
MFVFAAEEYKKPSTARLDEQLAQLVEFLAENAHEQWAGALLPFCYVIALR